MTAAIATRSGGRAAVVLVAAVVAGAIGFLLTFVVARTIGAAESAVFTAFWSGLYLVVGTLAGVQQEVARATRPASPGAVSTGGGTGTLRNFTLLAAGLVLALSAAVAACWVGPVFGSRAAAFVLPLAIGPTGYVVVAIVSGTLYGLARLRAIAALVLSDALLRFAAVCVVLLFTRDVLAIAWAVALPFGATILLLWRFIRSSIVGKSATDVPLGRLTTNALKTVVGSLAVAALVSGFSLIVVATSHEVAPIRLGAFVFAVTVVRAPIMVGVMSAQSLLIVRFRDPSGGTRFAVRLALGVIGVAVLLSAIATLIGDPVLAVLAGPDFRIGSFSLIVIVMSSALVGVLFVTGPFAIARSHHDVYVAGAVAAAALTIVVLLLPVDFATRTTVALLAAPLCGIAVHVAGMAIMARRRPRA